MTSRFVSLFLLSCLLFLEVCSAKNTPEGDRFLSENAARPEVVVLPSGLQYRVLHAGPKSGAHPGKADKVKVHYTGKLVDGKVFDSSVSRGEPITFGVTQVIKGWTEALQIMRPGDKWELAIPADLAYGRQDVGGGLIPANSVLVFEVELIKVIKSGASEL